MERESAKGRFLVAVLIAAIDGLLCAFVAVLALAFTLQSEPVPSAGGTADEGMIVVTLTWRSSVLADTVNNVVVGLQGRESACLSRDALPDLNGNFPSKDARNPGCAMVGVWIPCTVEEGVCTGVLTLQHVRPGDAQNFRVYIAGANDAERPAADRVEMIARVYSDSKSPAIELVSPELRMGNLQGAELEIAISRTGTVSAEWHETASLAVAP